MFAPLTSENATPARTTLQYSGYASSCERAIGMALPGILGKARTGLLSLEGAAQLLLQRQKVALHELRRGFIHGASLIGKLMADKKYLAACTCDTVPIRVCR